VTIAAIDSGPIRTEPGAILVAPERSSGPLYDYKIINSAGLQVEKKFDELGKEGYKFIAAVANVGLVFSKSIS
jgi:hypothetical protein